MEQKSVKEIIEETRITIMNRIEESETLLDDLMNDEPENEESAAYERWEEKVEDAEDWVERCREALEELRKYAISCGVEYKESDWIC